MRRAIAILVVLLPVLAVPFAAPLLVGHALFTLGFAHAAAPLLGDPSWRGYVLARDGDYGRAVEVLSQRPADSYNRGNALVAAGRYRDALDAYDDALDADPEDADARYNKALVEKILDTAATPPGQAKGNANASARSERHHGGVGNREGETNSVGIGFVGNKEGSSNSGAQGGSKVSKVGAGQTSESGLDSQKASGSAGQAAGKGRSGGNLADITAQLAANQRRVVRGFTARSIKPDAEWLQTVPDDPGSFLKLEIRAEQKRRLASEAARQGDD